VGCSKGGGYDAGGGEGLGPMLMQDVFFCFDSEVNHVQCHKQLLHWYSWIGNLEREVAAVLAFSQTLIGQRGGFAFVA